MNSGLARNNSDQQISASPTISRMGGKHLRHGYTTGACAAAAAKAACISLLRQIAVEFVEIPLPIGWTVKFEIARCVFDDKQSRCSVIKDGGDDPDVTHGAEICASVSWSSAPGVTINGGEGVGVVTKPGLGLEVGGPAINPVPRAMIEAAVTDLARSELANRGLNVMISVPKGAELAKRTLNARLGIIGGISILGTSGIVVPYSTDAFQASVSQALDVAQAAGCREVVLTTGGRSEKFAQKAHSLNEEAFIQMGDFVGHALDECSARDIPKVHIWGMVGKLCKMADGHFQTHVNNSQVATQLIAEIALTCGAPTEVVARVRQANTARHVLEIVGTLGVPGLFDAICRQAAINCAEHLHRAVRVECVMTDYDGIVLGRAWSDE